MGASALMAEADGIVRCDAAIASIKTPAAVSRMSNRIVALVVRGPATVASRRRGRSAPATTCFFPEAFFAVGRGGCVHTQRSFPRV